MRISGIHRYGLLGGSEGAARAVADHGGLSGGLGGVLTYAEPLRGIEAEKGFVACDIGGAGGEGEDGEEKERFHDDAAAVSILQFGSCGLPLSFSFTTSRVTALK